MVSRNLGRHKHIRRRKDGEMYGVTVSYRNVVVPVVTSRVGYGWTFAEAIEDADRQLTDGMWKRLVVSHPNSVFSDLQETRAARFARSTMRQGEGVTIKVQKSVTVEIPES